MSGQGDLFATQAKYCIDTNVIVSFLRGTDDEHYGAMCSNRSGISWSTRWYRAWSSLPVGSKRS